VKGNALSEELPKRKRGGSKRGRKITRFPLTTLHGLIYEAGAIYRRMKVGKIDTEAGKSLVWVLTAIRAMLEAQALERIESRLKELGQHAGVGEPMELKQIGHENTDREIGLAH
jgi:hypothetical protein